MGLSWQQGPLSAERGRPFPGTRNRYPSGCCSPSRCGVGCGCASGAHWIADSHDVVLLHEPARYPVAYFPGADIEPGALAEMAHRTRHRDLGPPRGSRAHRRLDASSGQPGSTSTCPPTPPRCEGRVAFAGERWMPSTRRTSASSATPPTPTTATTSGTASRHLVVREGDRVVAESTPRWSSTNRASRRAGIVPAPYIDESALVPTSGQTFCPYKGLATYYDSRHAREPPPGPTVRHGPRSPRARPRVFRTRSNSR